MRGIHAWLAVILGLFASLALRAEERETLSDFEKPGLADQFVAVRQITVSREPVAAMAPAEGPAGQAMAARTEGKSGVYSKPIAWKKDLLNASDLEMWIHRSRVEMARGPSTVEFQFIETDGQTKFWRKVEIDHAGWKKVSVPLRWFQWGDGRIPRWDRVTRWGIYFRDRADLQIDDVRLVRQDDPDIATPQPDDLRQIAFPEIPEKDVRVVGRGDFLVLTDEPALDVEKLMSHLAAVKKQLAADVPLPPSPPWPAPLIIFRTRAEYEAFPGRFAAKLNAGSVIPRTTGYTIQGISTSYWDESFGTLRPVYTHEIIHALLARELRLPNRSDWFQEGMAVHYQLQFHPQEDFAQILERGLADSTLRTPFAELTNGKPISQSRYWQAATLVELLMQDKKYQPQFPALLRAFDENASTELGKHLELLKTNWDDLSSDWQKFCREKYQVK